MSCNFRFEFTSRYLLTFLKKMVSEMSGFASEKHVHMYIVIQCCQSSIVEYGTTVSVVDCVKFSALVNQCVMPSCSLGGSTYPQKEKKKAGHSPYNVSYLFYETWFCCLTIFIKYFRGLTLFSITNVIVL
jgi:hypothetical protein